MTTGGVADSTHDDFALTLRARFASVRPLDDREISLLCSHYRLYVKWNRVLNLSSVRDVEAVAVRHYCESLFVAVSLPAGPWRIIDLGSGAGFPGYPVAVARPECQVVLVEGHQRKATFLKEATRGMPNVQVYGGRSETMQGRFDWMTSRAVAWREVKREWARLAARVALLVTERDAADIRRDPAVRWQEPQRLPWQEHTVLLIGECFT